MESIILQLISVGGDFGIWTLVYISWRFHSRLLIIETTLTMHIADETTHAWLRKDGKQ